MISETVLREISTAELVAVGVVFCAFGSRARPRLQGLGLIFLCLAAFVIAVVASLVPVAAVLPFAYWDRIAMTWFVRESAIIATLPLILATAVIWRLKGSSMRRFAWASAAFVVAVPLAFALNTVLKYTVFGL